MKVNIAKHDCTIQWGGIYYFALSDYPNISKWELKKLVYLSDYEKSYGREIQITCEDDNILKIVNQTLTSPETVLHEVVPKKITECTYCKQKGCLTKFVCHTATVENAKSIFTCGKILSAVKAFNMTGDELLKHYRNAASDTSDYFDYVMFAWGNCQAGDRLVMERTLKRNPDEFDLNEGFAPGVRFYFMYDKIITNPSFIFDGYHCAKIKDEILLSDYLYTCIIPEKHKAEFENIIPFDIVNKICYLKSEGLNLLDWSEKVYNLVSSTNE